MAETGTNRVKYELMNAYVTGRDVRMLVFLGTQTGVNDPDLNFVADLDAVSGVSIHSERVALTGETITENDALNRAEFDSDNVVYAPAAGVVAQGVAIFDNAGGSDAARTLMGIYTSGFPQPMDGGLTINVNDLIRVN